MHWGIWVAIVAVVMIVIAISIYEIAMTFQRQRDRSEIFKQAEIRSRATGKPLMVIGDPMNGVGSKTLGETYGCGNVCIDLTGCLKCPRGIGGDVMDALKRYPDDSHVVFVSCVLEYVHDLEACFREIERVSGHDTFIVFVNPYTLAAHFYHMIGESDSRYLIFKAPPNHDTLEYAPTKPFLSQHHQIHREN